jgi:hypothetical protein
MIKTSFQQIPGFVLFGIILLTSNLFGGKPSPLNDSTSYFLYIDYYGPRYNPNIQRYEYYLKVIKLPVHLLKSIPRLKSYGQYSKKNTRIYFKQQDIIRPFRGNSMIIRTDPHKLRDFYPAGLKKGFIIEENEFNRWDFIEKPRQHIDPIRKNNQQEWFYFDPIDFFFGEVNNT